MKFHLCKFAMEEYALQTPSDAQPANASIKPGVPYILNRQGARRILDDSINDTLRFSEFHAPTSPRYLPCLLLTAGPLPKQDSDLTHRFPLPLSMRPPPHPSRNQRINGLPAKAVAKEPEQPHGSQPHGLQTGPQGKSAGWHRGRDQADSVRAAQESRDFGHCLEGNRALHAQRMWGVACRL